MYLNLVDIDGKFIVVGVPPKPVGLGLGPLIHARRTFAGSLIGGVRETQEMLDFCGKPQSRYPALE
jgi:alcohol dehydrogenase (NADP+)